MVYCPKCGTQNEDEAKFCAKCGATLYPEKVEKRGEYTCFGPRGRRPEEECFGLPYGGAIVAIIFGALIIILGLSIVFQQDIGRWVGTFILVVIGILIILGAIYGMRRTYRR